MLIEIRTLGTKFYYADIGRSGPEPEAFTGETNDN
jgi:hypothetical protein